jgi:hypothetical protein
MFRILISLLSPAAPQPVPVLSATTVATRRRPK